MALVPGAGAACAAQQHATPAAGMALAGGYGCGRYSMDPRIHGVLLACSTAATLSAYMHQRIVLPRTDWMPSSLCAVFSVWPPVESTVGALHHAAIAWVQLPVSCWDEAASHHARNEGAGVCAGVRVGCSTSMQEHQLLGSYDASQPSCRSANIASCQQEVTRFSHHTAGQPCVVCWCCMLRDHGCHALARVHAT